MGGQTGGRTDCLGVIIKLNSVQLQLQLPAGTELGNIISRVWNMGLQISKHKRFDKVVVKKIKLLIWQGY